jgi:hypothetical protein
MKHLKILALIVLSILILGCVAEQPTTTAEPRETVTPKATRKPPRQPRKTTTTTLRPDIQEFRKAKETGSIDYCGNIESPRLRDTCMRDIALNTNNLRLCDSIQTQSIKDTCYYRIALNRTDSGICDQIVNSRLKELCPEMCDSVKAVQKDNIDACDKLQEQARDSCYFGIAVNRKDSSICSKISNKNMLKNCKSKASE